MQKLKLGVHGIANNGNVRLAYFHNFEGLLNICSMNIGVGGSSHLRRRALGIETSERDENDTKEQRPPTQRSLLGRVLTGKELCQRR